MSYLMGPDAPKLTPDDAAKQEKICLQSLPLLLSAFHSSLQILLRLGGVELSKRVPCQKQKKLVKFGPLKRRLYSSKPRNMGSKSKFLSHKE